MRVGQLWLQRLKRERGAYQSNNLRVPCLRGLRYGDPCARSVGKPIRRKKEKGKNILYKRREGEREK